MLVYKVFDLYRLSETDGNTAISASIDVLNNPGLPVQLTVGQRMRAIIQVGSGIAINVGDSFCFNAALFSPADNVLPLPIGSDLSGWTIECIDRSGGILTFSVLFRTGFGAEITQRNYEFSVSGTYGGSVENIDIVFDFYVLEDIATWINKAILNNSRRFPYSLFSPAGQPTEVVNGSAYASPKIAEFAFFRYDTSTLLPIQFAQASGFNANRIYCKLDLRFYDRGALNSQGWTGIALTHAGGLLWRVTLPNANPMLNLNTLEMARKAPPFSSNIGDNNYDIIADQVSIGVLSDFRAEIGLGQGGFEPNNVEIRLIEDGSSSNLSPIIQDVAISGTSLPAFHGAAVDTRLDGTLNGIFGTANTVWIAKAASIIWTISGATSNRIMLIRNIQIDGALLQLGKQYRVICVMTDTVTNESRSVISPVINPVPLAPTIGDIDQNVSNYNETASTNRPTVSPVERVRFRLKIDSTSYQNAVNPLTTDLRRVRFNLTYTPNFILPAVTQTAEYDFQAGQSIGQVPMVFSQVGTDLFFDVTVRAINQLPGAPLNRVGTTNWQIECEFPTPTGTDTLTVNVPASLEVRAAEDLTGVVSNIQFLDYTAWVGGQDVVRTSYCRNEDFATVKITLAPYVAPVLGAQLQAIFYQGLVVPYPSVQDEANYVSPR